jgi:hypothetical protein
MSDEEQAGQVYHTPNILIPHSALIGTKDFFLSLKEITFSRYICYKTHYVALLTRVTVSLHVLTYLPSLTCDGRNGNGCINGGEI